MAQLPDAQPEGPVPLQAAITGPLGWYQELTPKGRRTFWASFCGWGLDSMDQNIYGFILPTLMALWHMSGTQAGSIMTIALLSSSIGGWIGGILADRLGRVRALQITVLWFALFSVVCALTSSYTELLIARGLFGIGFGAEWGIGVALIGEIASARHRGTAAGNVHSAWSVGWGLAGILYALYFAVLPETIAWRALFATGVVPALFIFWIRQYVEESPLYLKMRREAPAQSWTSFREIFSGNLLRPTILGAVLAMGIQGGGYTVATWLPAFLKTVRHLSILNTSGYLMLFIGATFVGYVGGAYLSDMIGRRRTFIFFAVFQGCVAFIYTYLPITDSMMLVMGIPLGLGFAGAYSGFGAQLNELFPTRVRGSGIGFTFNFGRACGSLFPFLVGAYSSSLGLGPSVALFTAAAYALAVIAALLLPETSGKELG